MRIAIVSDIHGNLTAFEAVLADLRETAPDLVLHGGDLADAGSSPADIVDHIRALGWPGVSGNTDEMLFRPESVIEFAEQSAGFRPLLPTVQTMAAATREALGPDRLAWLAALPRLHIQGEIALVHASPASPWRAPLPQTPDAELHATYAPLERPVAVHGHIHLPYIRTLAQLTVANAGSVSLPYDGDPRASYLLLDGVVPSIRRVAYNVDREVAALTQSGLPHAEWVASMLTTARPQMPALP